MLHYILFLFALLPLGAWAQTAPATDAAQTAPAPTATEPENPTFRSDFDFQGFEMQLKLFDRPTGLPEVRLYLNQATSLNKRYKAATDADYTAIANAAPESLDEINSLWSTDDGTIGAQLRKALSPSEYQANVDKSNKRLVVELKKALKVFIDGQPADGAADDGQPANSKTKPAQAKAQANANDLKELAETLRQALKEEIKNIRDDNSLLYKQLEQIFPGDKKAENPRSLLFILNKEDEIALADFKKAAAAEKPNRDPNADPAGASSAPFATVVTHGAEDLNIVSKLAGALITFIDDKRTQYGATDLAEGDVLQRLAYEKATLLHAQLVLAMNDAFTELEAGVMLAKESAPIYGEGNEPDDNENDQATGGAGTVGLHYILPAARADFKDLPMGKRFTNYHTAWNDVRLALERGLKDKVKFNFLIENARALLANPTDSNSARLLRLCNHIGIATQGSYISQLQNTTLIAGSDGRVNLYTFGNDTYVQASICGQMGYLKLEPNCTGSDPCAFLPKMYYEGKTRPNEDEMRASKEWEDFEAALNAFAAYNPATLGLGRAAYQAILKKAGVGKPLPVTAKGKKQIQANTKAYTAKLANWQGDTAALGKAKRADLDKTKELVKAITASLHTLVASYGDFYSVDGRMTLQNLLTHCCDKQIQHIPFYGQ